VGAAFSRDKRSRMNTDYRDCQPVPPPISPESTMSTVKVSPIGFESER
jgi:hypothetical protein